MSLWGWGPERTEGVWQYGPKGLKTLVASAPWLTLLFLVALLYVVGETFTAAKGVLFDLPTGALAEGETTGLVALVMPTDRETLVFFDDSRYQLGDAASSQALGEHFAESVRRTGDTSLLVLADRRVPCGELMAFSALARKGGFEKVLFAEKRPEKTE